MDYTVHGILQATVLEGVAFPFSRVSCPQIPAPGNDELVNICCFKLLDEPLDH